MIDHQPASFILLGVMADGPLREQNQINRGGACPVRVLTGHHPHGACSLSVTHFVCAIGFCRHHTLFYYFQGGAICAQTPPVRQSIQREFPRTRHSEYPHPPRLHAARSRLERLRNIVP